LSCEAQDPPAVPAPATRLLSGRSRA